MCQIDSKARKIKRPMIVYKYAENGDRSQFRPQDRSKIYGCDSLGEELFYFKGRTTVSPSGPGIMAYVKKPRTCIESYLILRVPRGAVVRKGFDNMRPIVAASKVVMVERMKLKRNRR